MNLRNRPPVLVPSAHRAELEKLSKAALMDIVWSLAGTGCESSDDTALVIERLRLEIAAVTAARATT